MGNFIGSGRKPQRGPNRKALLIGIEYQGLDDLAIPSARTDAEYWENFLLAGYGYSKSDIRLITDSAEPPLQPSHENIVNSMKWLVEDLQSGDKRFLFVACHGTQTNQADDGSSQYTECDRRDESIVIRKNPDGTFETLKDNDIKTLVVDPLVKGSKLTAVIDTCHSGTLLDLPFQVGVTRVGSLKFTDARGDMKKVKKPKGTVVCVSACADGEQAHQWEQKPGTVDGGDNAEEERPGVGALTLALKEHFEHGKRRPVSIRKLIRSLKRSERLRVPNQTPWVACGRKQYLLDFDP